MRGYCIFVLTLFVGLTGQAAVADEAALFGCIAEVVRQHCPEAAIASTANNFTTKHGTMMFAVHRQWMTGEFNPEADRVEGPNAKGFMLNILIQPGQYTGQTIVPQILREPYWQTFIHRPPTEDGQSHYVINFSFGARLNPELKRAVFGLISPAGFQYQDGLPVSGDG